MKMRIRNVTLCLLLVLLLTTKYVDAEWIEIEKPGASRTQPNGIDDGNIVGFYYGLEGERGFLYNLKTDTWTSLSFPGASLTSAFDIDGGNIVGYYIGSGGVNGFLYNSSTNGWTTIDLPGETYPYAIDGDIIVGSYGEPGAYKGFLYNHVTLEWLTLEPLGASQTQTVAQGIDNSTVVGYGYLPSGDYGWLYDIATGVFTPFYGPEGNWAYPFDIKGNYITGRYYADGAKGFLYDGSNWMNLEFPGATTTCPLDIDGSKIVGYYDAPSSPVHGFLFIITIDVTIDIDPDTLNLSSNDMWVTCYIELPDGYDVMDIDGATVVLEGDIPAYIGKEGWARAGANSSNIMDHDGDGILERMVKFDKSEVQEYLTGLSGAVELMVSGELVDGPSFEGTDIIKVIN
jgi:hypothetical protein